MSELFPTEIRTQAIGITEALYLASEGVGVKLFPEMRNSMGLCGVLLLYAAMGYLNVFWGGLTIPDNRGNSITTDTMASDRNNLKAVKVLNYTVFEI